MRLWPKADGDEGRWTCSVTDVLGGVLAISQFTLMARMHKGAKPDFHEAMSPAEAKEIFDQTVQLLRDSYPGGLVQTGAFGELMEVELVNHGPVTIILDSKASIGESKDS